MYSLKGVLLSIEKIETNRVIFVEANFVANEGMDKGAGGTGTCFTE